MKKIFLFVILMVCVAFATQQSVSGNASGWTVASTDTLILNGNATIDASFTCTAFWIPSGTTYTLSKSGSGRVVTLTGGGIFWKDSSTGTKTYPDSIKHTTNDGVMRVSSLSGTLTATSTHLSFAKNDTLSDYKISTYQTLTIADDVTVTVTGANVSFTNSGPCIVFKNGGALNCLNQVTCNMNSNSDAYTVTAGSPQIIGSSILNLRGNAASSTVTLPALTLAGTTTLNVRHGSTFTTTYTMTGVVSGKTLQLNTASTGTTTFRTGNYNLAAGSGLSFGPNNAGSTWLGVWGSSTITASAVNGTSYNTGTGTDSLQTSTWIDSGNFTWPSNRTVIPGTSVFYSTPASGVTATITNNNKSWYNFKVNGAAGTTAKTLLADSLTVLGNLIDSTGKFFTAGNNINLTGDFYRYSTDSISMSTTRVTLNKQNALWYRRAAIFDRGTRSATIAALNGIDFNVDSNMTFYRIYMGASKKMQLTAGKILKDSTYTAADLDNDTIISRTSGSKAYFNAPANTAVTNTYFKDIYSVNLLYDTASNGGYNGGNDSNIVFKDGIGSKYTSGATVVGMQEARPATGSASGGYADTIIGFGFYSPCSLFVNNSYVASTVIDSNRITFTMPSVSAGAVSFRVKNVDGAIPDTTTRNMALLATVTDSNNNGASYVGSKACDNNTATYWWGVSGVSWIKADLGHDKYVDSINTYMQFSNAWKYKIEYATDSAPTVWNMYVDKTANTVTDTIYTNINLSKKGRYWKFTQTNAALWGAVREFRLYGKRTKTFNLFTATGGGGCISSISYADSPISDTINKSKTHSVTLGGCAPDSFVVIGTALPTGFSINKTSGLISYNGGGTPQAASNYTIRAYGTNKTDSASATVSIAIIINAPVVSYTTPVTDTTGKAASHSITSTGGAVDSFVVTSGSLPAGLSLTKATGLISGTPTTVAGASTIVVTAYNNGGTDTAAISITVVGCISGMAFAGSPKTYITGFTDSQAVTWIGCNPDSVIAISAMPSGFTYNKVLWRIKYDGLGGALTKTGLEFRAYGSGKTDSATFYDTVTVSNVVPAPVITAITPAYGKTTGGTKSYMTKTSLVDSVWYGTTAGTVSGDTITSPVHAKGIVDIIVANSAGRDTLVNGFEYINIRNVAISPTSQGDTLAGTTVNFTATYGLTGTSLTSGAPLGSYTVLTDSTATATSLAKSVGAYTFKVYAGTDSSNALAYTYGGERKRQNKWIGFGFWGRW
jgi:hypothetical protein